MLTEFIIVDEAHYQIKQNSYILHSQLLNIIILKFTSPVLLNLLGNIFMYFPAAEGMQRVHSSSIYLQGRSMLDL